jgi:hypothetical protein
VIDSLGIDRNSRDAVFGVGKRDRDRIRCERRCRACNYSVTASQIPVASDSDRKVAPVIKQTHIQVEALEPTVSLRLVRTPSYGGIWQQHIASAFCLIVDIVLSPDTAPVSLRERKVL